MSDQLNIILNGKNVKGTPGETILQLAKCNGIEIPTLEKVQLRDSDSDGLTDMKEKRAQLGETPLLFDNNEMNEWKQKVEQLSKEVADLEKAYNEKLITIFRNALEWRFEFPEIFYNIFLNFS